MDTYKLNQLNLYPKKGVEVENEKKNGKIISIAIISATFFLYFFAVIMAEGVCSLFNHKAWAYNDLLPDYWSHVFNISKQKSCFLKFF